MISLALIILGLVVIFGQLNEARFYERPPDRKILILGIFILLSGLLSNLW
jgi:predicted MFS family arabinose efflux permease